jgi:DNA modification methylase
MLITYVNTCSTIHAKEMLATLTFKHRNNVKTTEKSFEKGEEFRYLGTTLTNQNSIHEEIRRRLKLGNACYHSVQNLLSSGLLSKKTKIKIYRTAIFPVALYGCETWPLAQRDEHG